MKKGFLAISILIALGAGLFYFLKPAKPSILFAKTIKTNTKAFSRTINEENSWKKWWPGKVTRRTTNDSSSFEYNGYAYRITGKRYSSLLINIARNEMRISTELIFIPIANDSVVMRWKSDTLIAANSGASLKSITSDLNRDFKTIIGAIETFYANDANIYGLLFEKKQVVDSILISTSVQLNTYPKTADIYQMINKLRAFAKANGAAETGYPMLNISTEDNTHYKAQVAIPVNKKLQDKGDIHYKWMLGGGKILVGEVKGGLNTISKGMGEMENYVTDNGLVAPAIPFQSLVTDRSMESDTSKWVTKLYWPVM